MRKCFGSHSSPHKTFDRLQQEKKNKRNTVQNACSTTTLCPTNSLCHNAPGVLCCMCYIYLYVAHLVDGLLSGVDPLEVTVRHRLDLFRWVQQLSRRVSGCCGGARAAEREGVSTKAPHSEHVQNFCSPTLGVGKHHAESNKSETHTTNDTRHTLPQPPLPITPILHMISGQKITPTRTHKKKTYYNSPLICKIFRGNNHTPTRKNNAPYHTTTTITTITTTIPAPILTAI